MIEFASLHKTLLRLTAAMAGPDITDVPTPLLVAEVQRRMDCALKPEKRILLIGAPCRSRCRSLCSLLRRPAWVRKRHAVAEDQGAHLC